MLGSGGWGTRDGSHLGVEKWGWGDEGWFTPGCWEVGVGRRGLVHTWVLGSAPGLELLIQLGSFTFSALASPVTSKYKLRGPTCGISAVSRK